MQPAPEVSIPPAVLGLAGVKLLPLRRGLKSPLRGGQGWKDAVDADDVVLLDGQNYGIALLPSGLCCVDIDHPEEAQLIENRLRQDLTWRSRTTRGTHYVFRLPAGFRAENTKFPWGEILFNGYIVGPGSRVCALCGKDADACPHDGSSSTWYVLEDDREPAKAPSWLLALAQVAQETAPGATEARSLDRIPAGERDASLSALFGQMLRSRVPVSEQWAREALRTMLANPKLVEDGRSMLKERGTVERITRSALAYGERNPAKAPLNLVQDGWVRMVDLPDWQGDLQWVIDDFIPLGSLVVLYGAGGAGKSTFAAWVAARITMLGKTFAFVGAGEEDGRDFACKVKACGGNPNLLVTMDEQKLLRIPEHTAELAEAIARTDIATVYFDAYRSHMTLMQGANEADRTRLALQPIAQLAQTSGALVLLNTHERKDGDTFLGSTEVENVGRAMLHLKRLKSGRAYLSVRKCNWKKPEAPLLLTFGTVPLTHPGSGVGRVEVRSDGTRRPVMVPIVTDAVVGFDADEEAEQSESPAYVPREQLPEEKAEEARKTRRKRV